MRVFLSTAIAAIAGAANFYLLRLLWGYIPQINPALAWFSENLAGTALFRPMLFVHDLLINLALALPLAVLIYCLRPRHYLLYLSVALLPGFLWENQVWLGNSAFQAYWPSIVSGWVIELACVPMVLFLIVWCFGNKKHRRGGG